MWAEQKDTKANVMEEASTMMADSARLRNLLTKPPSNAMDGGSDPDSKNKHRILKELLNQQDEDDAKADNRSSPRGMGAHRDTAKASSSSSGGNNMLLQVSDLFAIFNLFINVRNLAN